MSVSRQGKIQKRSSVAAKGRSERKQDGRPRSKATDPRANQRERTRTAIMEGARKLLLAGKMPSVPEAAREARVSRATAYRYFPTQGALIREAVDAALTQPWEWEKRLDGSGGLPERVERIASEMFDLMRENEALLRGALLLSLEQWAKVQAGEDLGEEPIKRGGRREGIRVALEPFEGKLDAETLRRLAIAISIVIGVESRVVLRDIWNLDEDEAKDMTVWIARTLARAAV
jgi:AcrR family transcriptional regulator